MNVKDTNSLIGLLSFSLFDFSSFIIINVWRHKQSVKDRTLIAALHLMQFHIST